MALPSANARSIASGPCLIARDLTVSASLSSVTTSVASPCGVFIVSVITHPPSCSATTVVAESAIECPPVSMISAWILVPAASVETGFRAPTAVASIYLASLTVFGSTVISLRRVDTSAGIVS